MTGVQTCALPICQCGTEFFRHIPTNTERAPYDDAELAAMGYASRKKMFSEVINRDGTDDSKWEMTMRVPMRFNRLVLLRPWLWHTAGPARSEEHTSELQSLMRNSYAVFCLKKKNYTR